MDYSDILKSAEHYLAEETEQRFIDEVKALIEKKDEKELYDRFYRDLEFGTAGLRGIIGGGTNRMNPNVIKKATQGLASYLIKAKPEKAAQGSLSAVIAYDSRHYSDIFAKTAALIFAANNIKCYLFSSLRPTPELSYAIRELGCDTGIVVTASHNPPAYNGYKVYWSDGAQITPPHDTGIIEEVNAVSSVKMMEEDAALRAGKLHIIDTEIDEKYWALLKRKITRTDIIQEMSKSVKIVYTPLHGTGAVHVEKVLGDLGFNVITVPEQRKPDGSFPTVSYPNPEDPKALKMAIELAEKEGADILMATDPDADRFACAVKDRNGKMQLISGNQMGALFTDYLCLTLKENGRLPKNAAVVRSIVTSSLSDRIAASYGVKTVECLTGFKWIGDQIAGLEKEGETDRFIFGFEESYGYLAGPYVRDKDAVVASMLICEMAAYYRSKGSSIKQRLEEIYQQYGRYLNQVDSFEFPGLSGMEKMSAIMESLRKNPLTEIAGVKVVQVTDYEEPEKTGLPKANILIYALEDGSGVVVRPSGTEPKIKIYFTTKGQDLAEAKAKKDALSASMKPFLS